MRMPDFALLRDVFQVEYLREYPLDMLKCYFRRKETGRQRFGRPKFLARPIHIPSGDHHHHPYHPVCGAV